MKTTLDLPDDLVRAVKFRALEENRKLKDMVAELLRRGLDRPDVIAPAQQRVRLPIIVGGHHAAPDQEMTPERVADILLSGDLDQIQK